MPTYEYKREDGSIFEINQKMSEDALTICPATGQKVKRIISGGGGVLYKGDGWYVTDYKNGGRKSGEKETAPKKEGAKAEAPKTEKPAKETKTSE
ncbi:MAG: FmdB family zinc ribbon protein [Balneolaceae bacterium]